MAASTAAGSSPGARTGSPWRSSSPATCSAVPASRPASSSERRSAATRPIDDALAVREAAVAGHGLDPVADRVPEVEDGAAARDPPGRPPRRASSRPRSAARARCARRCRRCPAPSPRRAPTAVRRRAAPVLTTSAMPPAHSRGGSVSSSDGIAEHGLRLPERADVVLGGDVDRRLAADRRVDLADERRGHREPGHAAPERGGGEAADVGDGAAAGAHDHVAALELPLGEGAPEPLERRQRLGLLAALELDRAGARERQRAVDDRDGALAQRASRRCQGASRPAGRSRPRPPRGDSSPATIASAAAAVQRPALVVQLLEAPPCRPPAAACPARRPSRCQHDRDGRVEPRAQRALAHQPPRRLGRRARRRRARSPARRRARAARARPTPRARGRPPRRRAPRVRAPSSPRVARPRRRCRRTGRRAGGPARGRPCSCRRP